MPETDLISRSQVNPYAWLLENTSEAVWRFDVKIPIPVNLPAEEQFERIYRDAFLAHCNSATAVLYGFNSPKEALGLSLNDVMPQSERQNVDYILAFIRGNYRLVDAESIERHQDGSTLHLLNTLIGHVENGHLLRAWGTSRDITAQRAAERALRASEEHFRRLMEQSPLSIQVINRAGRLVRANGAWERLWGVGPGDLADFSVFDDPQLRGNGVAGCIQRAFDGEQSMVPPFPFTPQFGRWKGQEIWARGIVYPVVQDDGRIEEVVVIQENISRQRAAEEVVRKSQARARGLFQSNLCGIAFWHIDGGVVEANDEYLRIVGYSRAEFEAVGRIAWRELTPPEHEAADARALAQVVQRGRSDVYEKEYLRRDGTRIPILLAIASLKESPEGVAFALDITDRKRMENDLRAAQRQLEAHAGELERIVEERTRKLRESNAELEGFSYTVSHDIRAPLRALAGYASVLIEDYSKNLPEEARDYLDRIGRSAERLDALTQDVLTYTRLARAETPLKMVDLDALIPRIIQEYPNLSALGERIHLARPLLRVCAHEASLTTCVSNLLGNAVKFVRPPNEPAVEVSTERRGDMVRLWIKDNGIGIAPENHQRVFQLFERVNPASEFDGTGIGLAIVKKTVEKMGGRIGVESELGKGSRFWIDLPTAD